MNSTAEAEALRLRFPMSCVIARDLVAGVGTMRTGSAAGRGGENGLDPPIAGRRSVRDLWAEERDFPQCVPLSASDTRCSSDWGRSMSNHDSRA
jgi:hypothetical protein